MLKRTWMIGSIVAFMVLVAAPAGAGPKGTDRPFWGEATGEVTFEFGAPCLEGPIVTTTASGKATHMGRVTAVWTQCAVGQTGGWTGQTATIEAANGDELWLDGGDNRSGATSFSVTIVGGTGRFEGATGTLEATGIVVPEFLPDCTPTPPEDLCFNPMVPWAWSGMLDGRIDY